MFQNAAQDKSTVIEKDEFWPLRGMIDNMGNEEKQSLTQELIKLAPTVIDSLSRSENMNDIMLSFFRLVAEQNFPLDNISLLKKGRSIATEPHGMKIKQGLLEKYGSCGLDMNETMSDKKERLLKRSKEIDNVLEEHEGNLRYLNETRQVH